MNDFSYFGLLVTPILPTMFCVNWPFGSREGAQNRFLSSHLGFLIGTILTFFHFQVIPILSTKFRVNWPFGSGEEALIDFQDGNHGAILDF